MCGIVGYTGPHQASPILLAGLRRLEYRGYDSAGLATLEGERLVVHGGRIGETAQKQFIVLFGSILRLQNILTSFDEFAGNEILTERQSQDYRSVYLNFYAEFRKGDESEKESINDDIVFEIELTEPAIR